VDHRKALLDVLGERGAAKSICPSEVMQKSQRVNPETARGPIRYRLPCPSEM